MPSPRNPKSTSRTRDPRRLAYDLGRAFAAHTRMDQLVPFTVATCREVLDAEGAALMLLDKERDQLYFPHVADEDPEVAQRLAALRFPADRGVAGAVLRVGQSLRVDDAGHDQRFYSGIDSCTGLVTRALIGAPLIVYGEPYGVVEVINPRGRAHFDEEDLGLLEVIALSLAEAVERNEHEAAVGAADDESDESSRDEFRREGDFWSVRFAGKLVRLKHTKGVTYLALLLQNPGTDMHALDVASGMTAGTDSGSGSRSAAAVIGTEVGVQIGGPGDAGALLDARARAAYRERLEELRDELLEAEHINDAGRLEKVRAEMTVLEDELAGAFGLGGDRERRAASLTERARLNVTRAIRAVLRTVAQHHPELGAHLDRAVKTGTFCSYSPDPGLKIDWHF